MAFPGPSLEIQRSLEGEAHLTLFSDPDLTPDDYTWTATWFVDGTQDVAAIESVVVVKGGTPHPSVKGHTGGSVYGDNLHPRNGITLTFPSYAAGDLVIVWVCDSATSTTLSIPVGGWTNLFTWTGASERLYAWARIMTGGEGSTLTIHSSTSTFARLAAAMAVVQDIHGSTVATAIDDQDVHNDSINTHLCVAGPATVSVDGGLAFPCYGVDPTGAFHNGQFVADSKTGGAVPIASFDFAQTTAEVLT